MLNIKYQKYHENYVLYYIIILVFYIILYKLF